MLGLLKDPDLRLSVSGKTRVTCGLKHGSDRRDKVTAPIQQTIL